MSSSGIKRGLAATAVSALAVAGLPLLAGTAHAEPTTVRIVNERDDRLNFDTDELRDNDDFTIETSDAAGEPDKSVAPEYRWVLAPAGGGTAVEGSWIAAAPRKGPGSAGRWQVYGPSRVLAGADDGIGPRKVQDGAWTLEAQVAGATTITADPEEVRAAESEIDLTGGPGNPAAGGEYTVTGVLKNGSTGLPGREVKLTYARGPGGDARITSPATVTTDDTGRFSVTLENPGPAGETGTLRAVATGEERGDMTQLGHDYGRDDSNNPGADAADSLKVTWEGTGQPIVAKLEGQSNGRRADQVKVVAPGKARGAQVRLFKVVNNRLQRLQTGQLNRRGDKLFKVSDRNGRRHTTYVAKVAATDLTKPDATNRRRVR